jgi:hypothetical protein
MTIPTEKIPKEQRIRSWNDFIGIARRRYVDGLWAFRGVSSIDSELIPSIGRKTAREKYSREWEEEIFYRFKQEAIPHLARLPPTEIAWLALARHHGLPTRLLDWSSSPLVAAFFAVSGARRGTNAPADSVVHAYKIDEYIGEEMIRNPFATRKRFIEIRVSHYSPRLTAQKGFFTLHGSPTKPLRHRTLHKMIIPGRLCADFEENLDLFGINAATLFPDLDGLAEYWGWYYREAV